MKLTPENARTMEPGSVLRDARVKGLQLRAFANSKTFYYQYRTKGGRVRRPKIGDYGSMTLEDARRVARELGVRVALGQDPVADWKAQRAEPTMAQLCERYLTDHARVHKKARSIEEDRRLIRRNILPAFGSRKISEVTRGDVIALHQGLSETPYGANRVLSLLSTIFSLAIHWEVLPRNNNPCAGVRRFREKARRRYMTPTEAVTVARLLEKYSTEYRQQVAFIYLLILTGARPDEIARAKWSDLRECNGSLVLDLDDSKTGARAIHMPQKLFELLREPQWVKDQTLTGIKSPRSLWKRIRDEAGCPDLRLYDLRHTFASMALKSGYNLAQIGELLGHSNAQTTKRYAHLIEEEAAAAAATTAGALENMMKG